MPKIVYHWSEFRDAQDCEHLALNGRYLFANGAQSDGDEYHQEPPTDARQLNLLLLEYKQADLKRWQGDFERLKLFVSVQSSYYAMGAGPAPGETDLDELKRIKSLIVTLRTEIAALEQELRHGADAPPDHAAIRAAERQERLNTAAGIRQQLAALGD